MTRHHDQMSRLDREPSRLTPAMTQRLTALPATYEQVGATLGTLPAGWDALERTEPVGLGREAFVRAAHAVLGWQLQLRVGIAVTASGPRVEADAVAVLRLGLGPMGLDAPVRVITVIDEADRQGFVYGTLPGHPECGEELFCVDLLSDETVTCTIRAFSRPATALARLVPPATRVVQRWMAGRYIAGLRR